MDNSPNANLFSVYICHRFSLHPMSWKKSYSKTLHPTQTLSAKNDFQLSYLAEYIHFDSIGLYLGFKGFGPLPLKINMLQIQFENKEACEPWIDRMLNNQHVNIVNAYDFKVLDI